MPPLKEKLDALVRDLPDAAGARLFFERLSREHPRVADKLARVEGLCADSLALAAWSPLLSVTLTQHPEYLSWLARERTQTRVKTPDELKESLARFGLTHSQLDPHVLLSRFRRRELLRIYLRDIRSVNTVVEICEELSNLADAILEHALSLARQELENRYGAPLYLDEKGRLTGASFCIVALGKLGSGELNYASDIDLLFLYSADGQTSGQGERGEISNREYFIKLAEAVARTVGQPTGEGAAYRVDLRLRPHGRVGALASSLDEAVRYYRVTAQAWERQTLIRSRAAAGQRELFARFASRVESSVYAPDETVERALGNVRLAKQKIDRQHPRDARGFNVKLGRGGIREIEFITQALQLAFGGRDEWLRAAHTLISLGRLADRHLITEPERVQLSAAYDFLRTLEHRLQMEQGLQTHSVPEESERRALVARRMGFTGADAESDFDAALLAHTTDVRAAFERLFGDDDKPAAQIDAPRVDKRAGRESDVLVESYEPVDAGAAAENIVAAVFAPRLFAAGEGETESASSSEFMRLLRAAAASSLNPHRAMSLLARIASSLDKSNVRLALTEAGFGALVRLCGASEFFGEMIAANPALISVITSGGAEGAPTDYRASLIGAVESAGSFRAELSALRRAWAKALVEIGTLDATGAIKMFEANRRQTELAAASLDAGCLIARREMERRYGQLSSEPQLAVLGLGRLGGGGMDYGSDLDVVLVYDDDAPTPIAALGHAEAYARYSELLVAALTSLTRDGSLYRVDLRLRPDGRNGPTCSGARAFTGYLAGRALPWEWLAYVKLRAAAGARELGLRVEGEARGLIHEAARGVEADVLRAETQRVRERLERERSVRRKGVGLDIKYGRGGMLDVYFATRYLQLRDGVPDDATDRSTRAMLARLRAGDSLDPMDYEAMQEGYALLRALDHNMRLIIGRSTRLPATDHPALLDIARRLDYSSADALIKDLRGRMAAIRAAYERITT